jgi:hypothetical protein
MSMIRSMILCCPNLGRLLNSFCEGCTWDIGSTHEAICFAINFDETSPPKSLFVSLGMREYENSHMTYRASPECWPCIVECSAGALGKPCR